MKKSLNTRVSALLIAAASLALAPIVNAQLITLGAGNLIITARGFSADTLITAGGVVKPAPGAFPTTNPGNPPEDTWGIFEIDSIDQGATNKFTDNTTNTVSTQYWGMFYNSSDTGETTVGGVEVFTGVGLKLDIYKVTINDQSDSQFLADANLGPVGGRTSVSTFTGITSGTKVFSAQLDGIMTSTFVLATGNTNASGLFNTTFNNLFDTGGGSLSELAFSLGGVLITNPPASPTPYWDVAFGGPISGTISAVPEPSTYGLMGAFALVGIAAVRRMKRRTVAA